MRLAIVGAFVAATGGAAEAQRWQDATAACTGTTTEWTNRVEIADIDGDGKLDVMLANGGDATTAGTAQPTRVWKNLGGWTGSGTHCTEISSAAVGDFTGHARVIKAVDVDGDGDLDLVTGGAYQSQLELYLRSPTGWTTATSQLPQQLTSIGDLEAGDVDGDGDLDLVLSEWGAADPSPAGAGGRTRLYLNNGSGTFTDDTATRMPDLLVKWSWDVELVDVDNDWDLDAVIASTYGTSSLLFKNDGTGHFTDAPDALPHFAGCRELEAMDVDRDGDLDLVTLDDGLELREHLLINNGSGTFSDDTANRLAGTANPANSEDRAAVWLDVDSDGDPDLLIGSRGSERLLINNGAGVFTAEAAAPTPDDTASTFGVAAADLDGDGRLDLVQGQGDPAASAKVQLASALVAIDYSAPSVTVETHYGSTLDGVIHARVHDNQSPSRVNDFERVWIEHDGVRAAFESPPLSTKTDMTWIGGYLWASPVLQYASNYRACARDRHLNEACSDWIHVYFPPSDGPYTDGIGHDAGDPVEPWKGDGGCCDAGASSLATPLVSCVWIALGLRRRRRGRTRAARN